jgi:hypothetical protein
VKHNLHHKNKLKNLRMNLRRRASKKLNQRQLKSLKPLKLLKHPNNHQKKKLKKRPKKKLRNNLRKKSKRRLRKR